MSESHYYLKVILPAENAKEIQTKLALFIKEVYAASHFWQDHRERAATDEFWLEFSVNFPTVAKYIDSLNIKPLNPNSLSGTLMWGDKNYYKDNIIVSDDATVFKWSSEQSVYLNLNGMVAFIKAEFNVIDARWTSEELLDAWEFMDNQDAGEVMEAILNQSKENLPAFMNLHPILDNYISAKLAEDE